MLVSWTTLSSLASLTHFQKRREESGELHVQAVSHHTVQCGTITLQYLKHDALRHCLSSNSNLELGHFFCYCRSCKNILTILLRESAYSAIDNSLFEIWFCHSANCIPVGQCLYTRPFPFLRRWVWLARLHTVMGESLAHSATLLLPVC